MRRFNPFIIHTIFFSFYISQESFSVADISSEQSVSSVDGALQSLSCLCWCDCLPPRLAICHGTRSVIFVNKDNKWVEECVLADGVASRDVAVAPTMGRSLFYVAVAVASKTPTNNSGLYVSSKMAFCVLFDFPSLFLSHFLITILYLIDVDVYFAQESR